MFFRAWTAEQAEALGVAGWVRNCPDGSVEAYLTGPAPVIAALVERLRRGPPAARVDEVSVEDAAVEPLSGFRVRR